jgi:cobalamin biosynthesis protein CobT
LETCKRTLQAAAQTEPTVATLVRTLRGLIAEFPKKASEDLALLTSSGRANEDFIKHCKELIEQTDSILALYEEDENNEEEGGEKGVEKSTEKADDELGEQEVEVMEEDEDNTDKEVSEDMKNILEYRIGQLLIIMQSIKYAHSTIADKKRKHSEM